MFEFFRVKKNLEKPKRWGLPTDGAIFGHTEKIKVNPKLTLLHIFSAIWETLVSRNPYVIERFELFDPTSNQMLNVAVLKGQEPHSIQLSISVVFQEQPDNQLSLSFYSDSFASFRMRGTYCLSEQNIRSQRTSMRKNFTEVEFRGAIDVDGKDTLGVGIFKPHNELEWTEEEKVRTDFLVLAIEHFSHFLELLEQKQRECFKTKKKRETV